MSSDTTLASVHLDIGELAQLMHASVSKDIKIKEQEILIIQLL